MLAWHGANMGGLESMECWWNEGKEMSYHLRQSFGRHGPCEAADTQCEELFEADGPNSAERNKH